MSVNEKMTALANKIRAKLNITNKLGLDEMIESIDPIYESGYEVGKSEGGDPSVLSSLIDRSITEIEIPDGVEKVGNYCFISCPNLTTAKLPNSVKIIGMYAFSGAIKLKNFDIPDGVIELGNYAFNSCQSVERFKIPKGVTSIPQYAFNYCTKCLEYDFSDHTDVPVLENVSAFGSINKSAKIYVPATLYDEWIEATNWVVYKDYIVSVDVKSEPNINNFNTAYKELL